ncbi:sulfotransferase family protein [Gracilibacillus sp. D59]|uniref:sulfotransferase family protein n=1 Tax=Gracilibacillus sp. D59 TaxID=3457434 RepID=UPI003FCC4FDB
MSKKVNLFLVGAAKAGTTSMHYYLNQSHEINSSYIKEPFFFTDRLSLTNSGKKLDWDSYHKLYKLSNKEYMYYLDASVSYLCFSEVAKDIYDYNPKAKIIIMLRDPIQRFLSYYKMYVKRKNLKMTPKQFLEEENTFLPKLEPGLYSDAIQEYLKYFGNNVHIIIFEELIDNPKKIEQNLKQFLEIESISLEVDKKLNESNKEKVKSISDFIHKDNKLKTFLKNSPIPTKLRRNAKMMLQQFNESDEKVKVNIDGEFKEFLIRYYKEDIKKLSKLLEKKLDKWGKYY